MFKVVKTHSYHINSHLQIFCFYFDWKILSYLNILLLKISIVNLRLILTYIIGNLITQPITKTRVCASISTLLFYIQWTRIRYCHEYTLDVNVRIAMGKHETGEEHKSSLGDLSELAFATFGNRWMDWASWTFPSLGTFFKYVDMIVSKFETDHFAEFTRKIMDVINERKVFT